MAKQISQNRIFFPIVTALYEWFIWNSSGNLYSSNPKCLVNPFTISILKPNFYPTFLNNVANPHELFFLSNKIFSTVPHSWLLSDFH